MDLVQNEIELIDTITYLLDTNIQMVSSNDRSVSISNHLLDTDYHTDGVRVICADRLYKLVRKRTVKND